MSEQGRQPDPGIDAYIDGVMTGSERHAFAQRLASDAALRAEMQCQRAIDARLAELYELPDRAVQAAASHLVKTINANGHAKHLKLTEPTGDTARPSRFQSLATMEIKPRHLVVIAALLAIAVLLAWQLWPGSTRSGGRGGFGYDMAMSIKQSPHAFYVAQVDRGFVPAWECPPNLFAEVSHQRLGEALTYSPPPPQGEHEVTMLGASYANIISTQSITMLLRVDGRPVVVLVDRADADPGQSLPADSGLYLHKRQVGGLVIYECSPLKDPCALPLFKVAEDFTPSPIGAPGMCPMH